MTTGFADAPGQCRMESQPGPRGGETIIMKITVLRTAAIGSLKPGTVGVTWTGDGTRTDLVKGVVKVIR